ncbi:helix-turn-helix domain-containing protein [Pimelobacter simplex]|uniref:helix-turn-helix domain-containing protein n=1 Tax=Nocardioides simplex TaxID=2045 RepID=UPI001934AAA7|nr:helix-turn-helix transcriptional regulator [Pimelobacter simplex]
MFGRPGDVTWIQPTTPAAYASARAAELQHHFVVESTVRLEQLGPSKFWLEERSGITPGRLSKLLRGYAQLTLRDVAAIEGILGPMLTELVFSRFVVRDSSLQVRYQHGQ